MKVVAVIQARLNSSRFPSKVIKEIRKDLSILDVVISRTLMAKNVHEVVLASAHHASENLLVELSHKYKIKCIFGSENDVLERFIDVGKKTHADAMVRITADCPLVDPEIIDSCISIFMEGGVDYVSNIDPPSYPDGFDVEVFSFSALCDSEKKAKNKSEREHVTSVLRSNSQYLKKNFEAEADHSDLRLTVDEPVDLEVIRAIYKFFEPRINFSYKEIMDLYKNIPEIFKLNLHIKRNSGMEMGKGQKLWIRAKSIIPGGGMLLSKRSEMFLPEKWPSYFSKTSGCFVWDLDNVRYIDMSLMGVGTNILGYSNRIIDDAVRGVIQDGNMSTLNAPEEVYLAESLVELHPWAEMVRFARTGGEANAIAIRIARAATGRDRVAICGYHGWHDWYLSANLGESKSLDGHLMPGLEPNGVPRSLAGLVAPFELNNCEQLESLLRNGGVGAIMMEVSRTEEVNVAFLSTVRSLANRYGAVLIFDECTSGFRQTLGGLHLAYKINPDVAIFGKAMGNGYAVTAVIGKKCIMDAAQKSFISSTFWTERIGSVAGLATIEEMKVQRSWEVITETGNLIKKKWVELAKKHNLKIKITGLASLASFTLDCQDWLSYKTYITQEMLRNGILASNAVYVSIAHTQEVISLYIESLDGIFRMIRACEEGSININQLLESPVCHQGFKRLN